MKVGIIGAGRIGGGIARQLAGAGQRSCCRSAGTLSRWSGWRPRSARARRPGARPEAAGFGEVVVISVPWSTLPQAIEQAGSLSGKIVIDTTNQFGGPPLPAAGETAAHFNAGRMPGARYTKSFNTLTSAFQAQTAGRTGEQKVVQWLCGDDAEAKQVVAGLITEAGFVPVDLGGTAGCAVMEAPRRPGAVYGEEYRAADAQAAAEAVRAGRPIPAVPRY